VKNVIGHSDSTRDLDQLRKIEITDYTYIDRVGQGSAIHKKVIAQQLEKVLPVAVKKSGAVFLTFTNWRARLRWLMAGM
jgi:Chaperone of endosialidase